MEKPLIAIVGAGAVGSTIAYAGIISQLPAELVLIDVDQKRCKGEALDLRDALAFRDGHTSIAAGTIEDLRRADIIIIAAGARQKPGQSRLELAAINKKIIADIIAQGKPFKSSALILVITNPVDILTQQVLELSGLPASQVFSSGTFIDTMRLQSLLAQELQVPQQDIQAFIIGEHGDSQVVAWSAATIGGRPLMDYPAATESKLKAIEKRVVGMAQEIISCKGATYYGIATGVISLCSMILADAKKIIPLSFYQKRYELCLSMPAMLGRHGIIQNVSLSMTTEERAQLDTSAECLRKYKD